MTAPEISVNQVARLTHPHGSVLRVVVVLQAYLDASGTSRRDEFAVVAGFAASESQWTKFVAEWKAFLAEVSLSRWHNTDFYALAGEYVGPEWREDGAKRLLSLRRIPEIIGAIKPFGIGVAVSYDDWERMQSIGKTPQNETAIGFCLDYCLEALIHRLHEIPKDEGIAIYIDHDENEMLAREITDWHIAYRRENSWEDDRSRPVGVWFQWNVKFVPLQAADVLANETFRYAKKRNGLPFLGATLYNQADPDASLIIERLRNDTYLAVELFQAGRLEMELDGRSSGQLRPDGKNPDAIARYRRFRGDLAGG